MQTVDQVIINELRGEIGRIESKEDQLTTAQYKLLLACRHILEVVL